MKEGGRRKMTLLWGCILSGLNHQVLQLLCSIIGTSDCKVAEAWYNSLFSVRFRQIMIKSVWQSNQAICWLSAERISKLVLLGSNKNHMGQNNFVRAFQDSKDTHNWLQISDYNNSIHYKMQNFTSFFWWLPMRRSSPFIFMLVITTWDV